MAAASMRLGDTDTTITEEPMRERRKKVRLGDNLSLPEKRAYVRIPQRHLLRFREFNYLDEPPRYFDAHCKDIGGGGLLFQAPHPFPVGTLLTMELKLPGWERFMTNPSSGRPPEGAQSLDVLAEVVRAETVTQDQVYDIGVVFVGIEEHHREALMGYIADHFSR